MIKLIQKIKRFLTTKSNKAQALKKFPRFIRLKKPQKHPESISNKFQRNMRNKLIKHLIKKAKIMKLEIDLKMIFSRIIVARPKS